MKKVVISMLLASVLVFSCSDKDEPLNEVSYSKPIKIFNSQAELDSTISATLAMNVDGLKSCDDKNGFNSFGRISDEFYESIVPENFKSVDDMLNFINENSEYIELIIDENGDSVVTTKYSNSIYRYVMNQDNLFQVNNIVHKVFNEGVVSTDVKNINKLVNSDKDDFLSFQDNPAFNVMITSSDVAFKGVSSCGTYASDFTRDGNNRIVIKIWAEAYYETDPLGNPWGSYLQFHYRTYAQKRTLGAWFGCKRTITAVFDATLYCGSHSKRFYITYNGTSPVSNVEGRPKDLTYDYGPGIGGLPVYFSSYNSWSHSSAGTTTVTCN